jgi:DNA-binding MarR family transcriptional regulator
MVSAVQGRREHMAEQAAKFELTLPQAHLLRLLELGPARTMASLAQALSCDASNITGIVDRLEARGLIQRGSAAHDRRTKTIVVTREGAAVIRDLRRNMFAPPEALRRLTSKQLTAFHRMIARAFGVPKKTRTPTH